MCCKALREQCQGLIDFSDAYDYFGKSRLTKALVRFGVRIRYFTKVLGYYLSSDKRVIKGPGAPKREVASEAKRMAVRAELVDTATRESREGRSSRPPRFRCCLNV